MNKFLGATKPECTPQNSLQIWLTAGEHRRKIQNSTRETSKSMADLASYNKHMIERNNKKHREGLKNVEDDRKDEFY